MDSEVRCDLQSAACHRQSVMPPAAISIPSRRKESARGIWPRRRCFARCRLRCPVSYCLASGFTFRQIIPCDWYYVAAGLVFQLALCCSRFYVSADFNLLPWCRRDRSSASGGMNQRTAIYCRQADPAAADENKRVQRYLEKRHRNGL